MSQHEDHDSRSHRFFSVGLVLLDAAFLLSMILLPLIWAMDPLQLRVGPVRLHAGWSAKVIIVPVVILVLRAMVQSCRKRSTGEGGKALLGRRWIATPVKLAVSTYLTVGLLEVALGVLGYEIDLPPVLFELENESGQVEKQQGYADPEFIFKFRKGEKYAGVMINSLGFRDREVEPVKPEGMVRVICMGDSCTAQGTPSYSGYLHAMLQESPLTASSWEAFNMAVYGYSSMQGLRVFQTQGKDLSPDVVTLYYGWNDHWLHRQNDRSRMALRMSPLQAKLYKHLREKRSFMMVRQLLEPTLRHNASRAEAGFRVPPDEYRAVMTEFVDEIRSVGATPLIITAPRRDADTGGVHAEHPEIDVDFNVVHDEYMEMTRALASELNVEVLDLHHHLADAKYDSYFRKDGIHLTQKALHHIAGMLYEKLAAMQAQARIASTATHACGGCTNGCGGCS